MYSEDKVIVTFIVAVAVAILGGALVSGVSETISRQACAEAGMEWQEGDCRRAP